MTPAESLPISLLLDSWSPGAPLELACVVGSQLRARGTSLAPSLAIGNGQLYIYHLGISSNIIFSLRSLLLCLKPPIARKPSLLATWGLVVSLRVINPSGHELRSKAWPPILDLFRSAAYSAKESWPCPHLWLWDSWTGKAFFPLVVPSFSCSNLFGKSKTARPPLTSLNYLVLDRPFWRPGSAYMLFYGFSANWSTRFNSSSNGSLHCNS